MKKIKSALISVYYKDGLERIVRKLAEDGVAIYSTGGTLSFIESLGLKATSVESLTGYPSILGGRVKTLHPKVFGGILARRDNPKDSEQAAQYEIPEIDAVIVDLYPFEQTVASGAPEQDVIEEDRHRRHLADPRRSEKFQGRRDRTFGRPVRRILRNHRRAA